MAWLYLCCAYFWHILYVVFHLSLEILDYFDLCIAILVLNFLWVSSMHSPNGWVRPNHPLWIMSNIFFPVGMVLSCHIGHPKTLLHFNHITWIWWFMYPFFLSFCTIDSRFVVWCDFQLTCLSYKQFSFC